MTMERNLADWLPDDAPWALLNVPTLEKQCAARNLPVSGGKWEMVKNLNRHQEIHGTEERKFFWTMKPIGLAYRGALEWAHDAKFRIVQVKDKSNLVGGHSVKHFKVTRDGDELVNVKLKCEPYCTCLGLDYVVPTCVHIIYVLRYVLNCPEPLRWQESFLSTELVNIYRHSYAVSTLLLTNWKGQDPLCALCFKAVAPAEEQRTCCFTCGRVMHTDCVGVAQKARALTKEEQCWRCEDETEWGIDKYCEPGQVQYPLVVPGTKAAPQARPGPGGDTAQQPNERTESGAVTTKDLSSSHDEHSRKSSGQQINNPSSISADSVPGTAKAPTSAATPDIALAPTSGTGFVENPVSITTNANISDSDSAKQVQDRNHMAKKFAEMQKRAKREHQKLNKKHKKEMKRHLRELKKHKKGHAKLEKKSKRELERLMKKSKKLEKKARSLHGEREGCEDA